MAENATAGCGGIRQEGTRLEEGLRAGEFVVTADLLPPKGGDLDSLIARAACLRGKVHGVNVADMPSAGLAQSGWAAAVRLLACSVEPILQVTCRDRNVLALQADLLAAHALGIRNVLVLTGDHVRFGDHAGAKPVFDVSATELLAVIESLNEGRAASGTPLQGPCAFFAGAATNPTQLPLEPQLLRTEVKARAGAHFFQTQPLFLVEQWLEFCSRLEEFGVETPVLAGTFLLESPGMARYMHNKVPGVVIPEKVRQGIEEAADPLDYGRSLAREFILAVRETAAPGIHLMTHNRFETVAELVDELRLAPA